MVIVGWEWPYLTAARASVVLSIQNWLGESAEAKKSSSQPAYFSVGMACEYLLFIM
jgi:hypothetical protein